MRTKIKMHDIREITDRIHPIVEQFKNTEDVEIEFRLGRHNGQFYDTNVGKDVWERVLQGLERYAGWEHVIKKEYDAFCNNEHGIRITMDTEGNQTMVQKIKLATEDFIGSSAPLDVRCAASREPTVEGTFACDRKVSKIRHSFVRKNLSIDMTLSNTLTGSEDPDNDDPYSYQIELEICNAASLTGCPDELFNIVNKVNDLCVLI